MRSVYSLELPMTMTTMFLQTLSILVGTMTGDNKQYAVEFRMFSRRFSRYLSTYTSTSKCVHHKTEKASKIAGDEESRLTTHASAVHGSELDHEAVAG